MGQCQGGPTPAEAIRSCMETTTTRIDRGLLRALAERRMIPLVGPELPPREMIEQVIQAGAWAPNHHRTEPWRFIVLAGDEREALGDVMAEARRDEMGPELSDEDQRALEKERAKPLRAPVVITVAAVPTRGPKVVEIEEVEATAAAVENMVLAAQALGLGAMWRTGKAAYNPEVKRFLRLPEEASIVAFLYLGYPQVSPSPRSRRTAEPHTTWRGWPGE